MWVKAKLITPCAPDPASQGQRLAFSCLWMEPALLIILLADMGVPTCSLEGTVPATLLWREPSAPWQQCTSTVDTDSRNQDALGVVLSNLLMFLEEFS